MSMNHTFYRENDLINNIEDFQKFSNYIAPEGNLILLGCFIGAPQLKGESYLKTFSGIVNRPVYGNQGESSLRYSVSFTGVPMGVSPMVKDKHNASYYDMAVQNAGKWLVGLPSGSVKTNIGNLGLNKTGSPYILSPSSAVKPVDKPLPSFQSILGNAESH
ncbi:hypothetical protein ACDQ55_17350 [Chitinophaga sp. 30R24]|uniref:hypothetical protein n=1 Tax=Chitinophaga sp. 30R24 TaxID=3248838 RepID=UPI003B8FA4CC